MPELIVTSSLGFAGAVMSEAGLSYLGLGIQPPTPSFGKMLSEAQAEILQAGWYVLVPAAAITLLVMGFNLIGDALQEVTSMAVEKPVLSIESLTVDFDLGKTCHAVRDTSVRIEPGEMVALVGESGCGKTMTALSAIGLQPRNAKIPQGKILFDGSDLRGPQRGAVEPVPGPEHRMIFQGAP